MSFLNIARIANADPCLNWRFILRSARFFPHIIHFFLRAFLSLENILSRNTLFKTPVKANWKTNGCKEHIYYGLLASKWTCFAFCSQGMTRGIFHSLLISREGLILTLSILPCPLGCSYILKIGFELMPAWTACPTITRSSEKIFRHISQYLTDCTTVLCWGPC